MGSLSVSTHRGLVHWQGFMLAVSLLTFWCLPIIAKFAVELPSVAVGWDVRLKLCNVHAKAYGFRWYRGEEAESYSLIKALLIKPVKFLQKGPEHRGRERILSDGSLLIRNVTMRDRGIFTVVAYISSNRRETAFGQLNVYEPVSDPTLVAYNTTVTENKDAMVFACNTNEVSVQWLFCGENLQLSERIKLSNEDRILTINPVKREDVGYYQCRVSNPISSANSTVFWLDVNHE